MAVKLLYRIDVGFDPERGYGAVVLDAANSTDKRLRQKGVRGNSVEQLASRLRHVLIDDMSKRRNFPLETQPAQKLIITPEDF